MCSCVHLSTFAVIMETNYSTTTTETTLSQETLTKSFTTSSQVNIFINITGPALLDKILNTIFTTLSHDVVVEKLKEITNCSIIKEEKYERNVSSVNKILMAIEKLVSALFVNVTTYNITPISLPNLDIEVLIVGPNASSVTIPPLSTGTAYLEIDIIAIAKNNNESAGVALMSYTNFSKWLGPDLYITTENTTKTMMSTVVSVKLFGVTNTQLTRPVNLTLNHTAEVEPDSTFVCVYWNNTKLQWDLDGCVLLQTNRTHSVCSCTHLSTFAVIMQTNPRQDESKILEIISNVFVAVGLLFLFLSLLTFARFWRNPRVNNTARINLCISLFLAQLLFLLTQSLLQYIKVYQKLCAVMAGVVEFLFLSAFVWMFIEAVLLFICVKNLKKLKSKQKEVLPWKYLIVIGYVIPLADVGVSVGLLPEAYSSEICWIEQKYVWTFLGPVCFVLVANLVLFIAIIITLKSTLMGLNSEHTQIKQMRSILFKALMQFFILGCPWILGFFTNYNEVLKYIFLFITSQQGTFIFIVHCVLNHEVRQQYRNWINTWRPFYKSVSITTIQKKISGNPDSKHQTQGLVRVKRLSASSSISWSTKTVSTE
ncbi:adhesion G protein-coupled receptor E3-like [Hoplias malabaricus]|uniref:adhesion G protein-coupled receptor E3-like n=1 Tax=Hoplias malabaricus TaxID=27720 RepID=UPI00346289B4